MHAKALPPPPSILHDARMAHVLHASRHVQFAQQIGAFGEVGDGFELVLVDVVEVFDGAEPVVEETELVVSRHARTGGGGGCCKSKLGREWKGRKDGNC